MDASAPKVAIDADGDAVVVWLVFDGTNDLVQARTIDAAGVRGPTLTLSAAGQDASFPQVAMNAGGDAAFAWQRSDGTNQRIQGIFRSAAGTLSPVIDLSNAGSNAVVPDVGIDDAGNHFFVWIGFDGSNFRAQLRIRGPGGTISTVADISNAGVNANSVQIAVGAAGDAGFTWLEQVPPTQRVMARVRTAFPVLGSIQQLSRSGISPQVAVDDSGDAVFAWTHFNGESDPAQTRTLPSGGTLSAVQKLANQASQPQVGVDSDGDAVYSWDRFDRVQARTRTWATGALGAIENLSEASVDAARSDVAVNALGGAIVGWGAFDGTFTRAQGAVGP